VIDPDLVLSILPVDIHLRPVCAKRRHRTAEPTERSVTCRLAGADQVGWIAGLTGQYR